nr:hypothetical protein [Tanacetum cinerariifolium]
MVSKNGYDVLGFIVSSYEDATSDVNLSLKTIAGKSVSTVRGRGRHRHARFYHMQQFSSCTPYHAYELFLPQARYTLPW